MPATASPRLVVHLGPHKTASTYIQENLARTRPALAGHGWDYPGIGIENGAGHHHLGQHPQTYLHPDGAAYAAFRALGQSRRNLIFSAEAISRWPLENLLSMGDVLGFATIEVVYVIRDPLSLIHSFWSEEVKQGRSLGFGDRLARELALGEASALFWPMTHLAPLLNHPRIRLHVVPLDLLRRRGVDIFEHVLRAVLGPEDIPAALRESVNTAYPVELTEFLRLMTLQVARGESRIGPDLRQWFMARTPPRTRTRLVRLVRDTAALTRQVIRIPGDSMFRTRLEQALRQIPGEHWTTDIGQAPLFPDEDMRYIYYDAYKMWKIPAIREEVLSRLALYRPAGANMTEGQ